MIELECVGTLPSIPAPTFMLRFFFTRKNLPTISTPEAMPFDLLSAAEFKDEIIPFSHMYLSSSAYLKQIMLSIGDEQQKHLIPVSEAQSQVILNQSNFPPNLTEYDIHSVSELKAVLGNVSANSKEIHIVIINGIGGDYGDNYIGLAILQRVCKLLAPAKVCFHLMQSFSTRFQEIYQNNAHLISGEVIIHNNVMTVERFMSMNAYIDLSGIVNYAEFDILSHNTFFSTAFSLENIISSENLHPALHTDLDISADLRAQIEARFDEDKPIILLHLIARESSRTCPPDFVSALINSLIAQGFNVITPNPVKFDDRSFCDCSDLATSIQALTHLLQASDSVVSTGSLSLNIAAAFGKPTTLLPVTKASIRTANQLPEVLIWLPHRNKPFYRDAANPVLEEDIKSAQQIWKNIDTDKLSLAVKGFLTSFEQTELRSLKKNSPKRIAVIIPASSNTAVAREMLNLCLDSLCQVQGFDALWLEIIDCDKNQTPLTHALNVGISKAIENNCDYIWFLNPEQQPKSDYLQHALKRFQSDESIALVAGMQINQQDKTRVIWSGSRSSFPKQQYKSGKITNSKVNTPTAENWVPFTSAILRTQAAIEIGLLDEKMRHQYSDIDYCFRLKQRAWSIAYEPKSQSFKVTNNHQLDQKELLKRDLKYFYRKWSYLTNCRDIDTLHSEILKYTHKKAQLRIKKFGLSPQLTSN